MSPVTHFFTGWVLANCARLDRRERALVTVAAVIPDMDGLGFLPEMLTAGSKHPLLWFSEYHHALHTLTFAVVVTVAALFLARQRWKTGALVFLSFHLHLLEDLAGSRGPDGYQWPIPYLKPFSSARQWTWSGQWGLNAWENYGITLGLLMVTFYLMWLKGYSPVEVFSARADQAYMKAFRYRFPGRA